MKKIAIITFSILVFCNNVHASSIWDHIYLGMTKKEFQKKVDGFYGFGSQFKKYRNTEELKKIDEKNNIGLVFTAKTYFNNKYIPELKMEILTHEYGSKKDYNVGEKMPDKFPFYVFENVKIWATCENVTFTYCGTIGDGILNAVFFGKDEAFAFVEMEK